MRAIETNLDILLRAPDCVLDRSVANGFFRTSTLALLNFSFSLLLSGYIAATLQTAWPQSLHTFPLNRWKPFY
jgi:hypothetical protein